MSDFVSYVMLLGALGTGGNMPFWATANQYGMMPESSGGMAQMYIGMPYAGNKDFQWHWALSLVDRSDRSSYFQMIADEAYAGIKWKPLSLDLGIIHHERKFMAADPALGSLSLTSGNIAWSGNSRSLPGYTLELKPWKVPGTKGILELDARWGDYITYDERFVRNAMVHNMALDFTINFWRFSLTAGLDHYAMWNGSSSSEGKLPGSIRTYFLVCLGRPDITGTRNDTGYVVGNHLGREIFRLVYHGDGWNITAQHDKPYEDQSGMLQFKNFPDGVNTLSFSFEDKDRWITNVVYEFAYTMNQSGPYHADKDWKILGGNDNYFNNSDYKSGWTYFGRTIGLPLITPTGTGDRSWNRNGITYGVENNRVKAHHIGLSGKLFRKAPYRLMLTYSRNYGKFAGHIGYDNSCEWPGLRQFSGALTAVVPFLENKLQLVPGLYVDAGDYLPVTCAVTLGLKYIIR